MASISLKVSDMEKKFLQSMAQFEGVTLSELIKSKVFDSLEDEYDARIADLRLSEYESLLRNVELGLFYILQFFHFKTSPPFFK